MESTLTPLELALMPNHVRLEVDRWNDAFTALTPPITAALKVTAAKLGASYATALRKYYAWKTHGPRALVNASEHPEFGLKRLPAFGRETFDHYHTLCLQNGRKNKPAFRKLTRAFLAGEPIPGIAATVPRDHLPAGWSYNTFRAHAPSQFEMKAARIGIKAAADYRPLVFTSRVGLRVGQFIFFDDVWHDFEVVVLGRRERCRLLQLHAHDLFSACQFARGIKPRVKKEEGDSVTGLVLKDMIFLIAHILARFGHHPEGTTIVLEAGTATLPAEVMALITRLAHGKVQFHVGAVDGGRAFAGQYLGRGKGNFRLKASLESSHNLLHNETADLLAFPGQVGSNARINAPEELHGRQRETDQLLFAMAALPLVVRQQLALSFLEVTQAIWAVEEVCERINCRTEHDLEGFVEAGLTTVDFFVPGVGTLTNAQMMALEPAKRQAVIALAESRARKLSPREVFDAGAVSLRRWKNEELALLLWHARRDEPVTVGKNHVVEFQDKTISPEPLRFLAHTFAVGEKFDAVVNPMDPSQLYIYAADGRWLGALEHWGRIRRDDMDGLERRMGRAESVKNDLLRPVRDAALTLARIERTEHNNAVLDAHANGPARERAQADARLVRDQDGAAAAESILQKVESREQKAESPSGEDDGSDFLSAIKGG